MPKKRNASRAGLSREERLRSAAEALVRLCGVCHETVVVEGTQSTTVGGSQTLTVGADQQSSVGGDRLTEIGGDLVAAIDHRITVTAGQGLLFRVGSSSIELRPSGEVVIKGTKVTIEASGNLRLKGSKILQN